MGEKIVTQALTMKYFYCTVQYSENIKSNAFVFAKEKRYCRGTTAPKTTNITAQSNVVQDKSSSVLYFSYLFGHDSCGCEFQSPI